MITTAQFLTSTVAMLFTLAIFSFLYKDNPFYKFSEHLLIGISVGYGLGYIYHSAFIPYILTPLTHAKNIGSFLMIIIPTFIGLLYFSFVIPKYRWMIRFPIAFFLGIGNGIAIPIVMQTRVFMQLKDSYILLRSSLSPLTFISIIVLTTAAGAFIVYILFFFEGEHYQVYRIFLVVVVAVLFIWAIYKFQIKNQTEWFFVLSNYIIVIGILFGILSALLYFFFSWRHTGIIGGISKLGRVFLMIGFGASFGLTVMGRVSLLIGRVDFLINIWLKQLLSFF
jgi:hypothetical protein